MGAKGCAKTGGGKTAVEAYAANTHVRGASRGSVCIGAGVRSRDEAGH